MGVARGVTLLHGVLPARLRDLEPGRARGERRHRPGRGRAAVARYGHGQLPSHSKEQEITMKHDDIERLETLLRDEGFTNLNTLRASHDVTISAAKGDTRLITHRIESASAPSHAQPHDDVPDPSVI